MSPALWAMAPLIKFLAGEGRGLIEKAFVSINNGSSFLSMAMIIKYAPMMT